MPRLIDYLRSHGVGGYSRESMHIGQAQRKRLNRSVPVLVVDQAAEFWAEHGGTGTMCPMIPDLWCALPPYDDCWIEYRFTRKLKEAIGSGDGTIDALHEAGAHVRSGTLADAPAWVAELNDVSADDRPGWTPYGWMELHLYMRMGGLKSARLCLQHRCVYNNLGAIGNACFSETWGMHLDRAARDGFIYPVLLGMSFMNFRKDVRLVERTPPTGAQHKHKGKKPLVRYHVLEIDAFGQRILSETSEEGPGRLKRALHAVRQHIRVYGPEKPHVSGYVGAMLIRPHLRGNASEGLVVKDYQLNGLVGAK